MTSGSKISRCKFFSAANHNAFQAGISLSLRRNLVFLSLSVSFFSQIVLKEHLGLGNSSRALQVSWLRNGAGKKGNGYELADSWHLTEYIVRDFQHTKQKKKDFLSFFRADSVKDRV